MPARQGPRFALEAGFLILLAVLAGLADLRWQAIVLVMAVAWLLIALLEWAFWREGPRLPPVPRGYAAWAPPVAPTAPASAERPPLPPREEGTRIIEPDELVELPEAAPTAEGEPEAPPEAEPVERRWFRRGREIAAEEQEPEAEAESEAERPVRDSGPVEGVPGEPGGSPARGAPAVPEEAVARRPWWWRRREPDAELEAAQPRHVRVLPPEREREEE